MHIGHCSAYSMHPPSQPAINAVHHMSIRGNELEWKVVRKCRSAHRPDIYIINLAYMGKPLHAYCRNNVENENIVASIKYQLRAETSQSKQRKVQNRRNLSMSTIKSRS